MIQSVLMAVIRVADSIMAVAEACLTYEPHDPDTLTHIMPMDEQEGIEAAALAEHRGQVWRAEEYRAAVGYDAWS